MVMELISYGGSDLGGVLEDSPGRASPCFYDHSQQTEKFERLIEIG